MVVGAEKLMDRRQIAEMIRRDPIDVQFVRRPKIETGAGGWRWGPAETLEPQRVCMIPFKRRMTDFLNNTELGDVPDLPYVLVGRHDLDVKKDDIFTVEGLGTFQVKTFDLSEPEVKTAVQVDYYGGERNG